MISFWTVTNQNLKIETIQYETVGFGAVIIWVEKKNVLVVVVPNWAVVDLFIQK